MYQIDDVLHGPQQIHEPLAVELLESNAMKRLGDVQVCGYAAPHVNGWKHSRLDHSIGVYLLLLRHSAKSHERIAGLLHDVSHGAFSHCLDYAFKDANGATQDLQDRMHRTILETSDIAPILSKSRMTVDHMLDETHVLLERTLPDVCADRLDYALRDAASSGEASVHDVRELNAQLKTRDGQWYFANRHGAEEFRDLFKVMNDRHYAGATSAMMHLSVGKYVAYALGLGIVTKDDLFTLSQTEVLLKIARYHEKDEVLLRWWNRMNGTPALWENIPTDEEERGTYPTISKSRAVDPLFREDTNGKHLRRLSDVDDAWAKALPGELVPRKHRIRFLDQTS